MSSMKSAIKYHGAKSYLAKRIVSLFPPHLHYVETHCGGCSVLFERDPLKDWMAGSGEKITSSNRGCSEVINDTNGKLTNFWRVLRDRFLFSRFQREIEATPFSRREFLDSLGPDLGVVESAENFFVRCRQSLAGRMDSFAAISRTRTRGGMNEQANAWWNAIDGLPEVHERLRRVVIENDDAIKVIRRHDGPHTLFYCDPPYLHSTRETTSEYGDHEMTESDHVLLIATLVCIQGKFVLSGYRNLLYDGFAAKHGWHRIDIEIDNKASHRKQKEIKIESLWMNYVPRKGC